MSQISLNDNTYTDDGSNRSLVDGGHRDYFFPMLEDLKTDQGRALSSVTSTSMTCAVGSKQMTLVTSGIAFGLGQFIAIAKTTDPTSVWMHGQVTQQSAQTLWATMNYAFGASGPHTTWRVQLSGPINPNSGGTVRSVAMVSSSDGIVISGSPVTGAGQMAIALTGDVGAIEALTGTGMVERLGTNSWQTFSLSSAGRSLISASSAAAMRSVLGLSAVDVQVFSVSGTWQAPTDAVVIMLIECWGGGGGGGGAGATGTNRAGGGGGGAYLYRWMRVSDVTSSVAVTVASGGTAGPTNGNSGGMGDSSSFGSYVIAYGGAGGFGANANNVTAQGGGGGGAFAVGSGIFGGGPAGGTYAASVDGFGGASGGSVASGGAIPGNAGYGGAGGAGADSGTQRAGGRSVYGGGGGGNGATSASSGGISLFGGAGGDGGAAGSAGSAGSRPGGGGGGGSGTSRAGGAGGPGLVRVTCF